MKRNLEWRPRRVLQDGDRVGVGWRHQTSTIEVWHNGRLVVERCLRDDAPTSVVSSPTKGGDGGTAGVAASPSLDGGPRISAASLDKTGAGPPTRPSSFGSSPGRGGNFPSEVGGVSTAAGLADYHMLYPIVDVAGHVKAVRFLQACKKPVREVLLEPGESTSDEEGGGTGRQGAV